MNEPTEPPAPLLWIVENETGVWVTKHEEIARKHVGKPGTVVTEYRSKL